MRSGIAYRIVCVCVVCYAVNVKYSRALIRAKFHQTNVGVTLSLQMSFFVATFVLGGGNKVSNY